MAVNIHNLIAAINPDLYCQSFANRNGRYINLVADVRKLAREQGHLATAEIARVKDSEFMDLEEARNQNPFSLLAIKNPIEKNTVVYDAFGENVTAVYFWLLDALKHHVENVQRIDKLVDNFVSSPGSQHFTDMTAKAMKAQDRALRFLEDARKAVQPIPALISEVKALKRQLEAVDQIHVLNEKELHHRLALKQTELKQQVAMAKTYARWVRPNLKVAGQIQPPASSGADLVTAFNTVLFELVLLVESTYPVDDDIGAGILPKIVSKMKNREYSPVMVVEMNFRGAPEKVRQGGYIYRGRSEITFTSYALNTDELKLLIEFIDKDELMDLWRSLFGDVDTTIDQFQKDIDELTQDTPDGKPISSTNSESKSEDVNPFTALWSFFFPPSASAESLPADDHRIRPDSRVEQVLRNQSVIRARQECRKIYNLFKQAHDMATMPDQESQAA
jgi:hypothetical protein